MREEVKKRQRDLQDKVDLAPPVDLKPTVFWQASGRRLEEVIKETAEVAEDRATDNALLQAQLASSKAAITGANQKFASADKKRLEELSKKKVYEFAILRVVCPDKSVLQVHFRAADKGEHVMNQVGPLLSAEVQKSGWYIYQSPPLKKLDPKETLAKQGFSPGASLYLGFDGAKPAGPFFNSGLVAQLGPAPADPRGAAGSAYSGEAMGWGAGQRLGAAPAAAAAAAPAADSSAVPMDTS